ncbi:ABC transporter substrate-binding protein [Leucobacter chinensis]|uniref:ABC transporter substrate-binding protein n=1 Tax=Leucobacter chinensis TaxID=2851010 RepID=UPI001C21DF34|nr:ABC transporter substrate-binding protein [Leucobacter chinensis]
MSALHRSLRSTLVAGIGITSLALLTACSPPDTGNGRGGEGDGGSTRLTVAETTAPSTLDPQRSGLFADRFAWQLSYECLMSTTAEGEVKPGLATEYTLSDDRTEYTFTLREGVTFHNGDSLDADDVVYSFERLSESPDRFDTELFPTLSHVEKVDDMNVKFVLDSPDAGFVNNMGNPLVWGCSIMSASSADDNLATQMIGTGPWAQTAYEPETSLTFERNDEYWGEKTKAEELSLLYIPNMGTQVSNLKAGNVDIIFPDQGSVEELKGDGFTVDNVHTDSTIFLQINNTKAPFDDERVLKAMALAFDRQELADQAYGGAAQPSGYLPPSLAWAPKVSDLPNHTQDSERAKELLAEAGHADGLDLSLIYINGYDPGTNDLLAIMQKQLGDAGFNVTLEPLEAAVWSATRGDLGVYELSWNAQSYYANPYQYVAPVPGRQGEVPASLQTLIDEAWNAASEEEYQSALSAVATHEAEIVYPTITLLARDMFVAYEAGVQGIDIPSSQSRTFLSQVTK